MPQLQKWFCNHQGSSECPSTDIVHKGIHTEWHGPSVPATSTQVEALNSLSIDADMSARTSPDYSEPLDKCESPLLHNGCVEKEGEVSRCEGASDSGFRNSSMWICSTRPEVVTRSWALGNRFFGRREFSNIIHRPSSRNYDWPMLCQASQGGSFLHKCTSPGTRGSSTFSVWLSTVILRRAFHSPPFNTKSSHHRYTSQSQGEYKRLNAGIVVNLQHPNYYFITPA